MKILSVLKMTISGDLGSGLPRLAHLLKLRLKLRIDPSIVAVGATPSPARSFWRCPWCRRLDEILVRTAVPFTGLVQSVLRSTAVSVQLPGKDLV
eukprot:SAG11_NODE_21492_length_424_cov_0.793846_1_plen_95_part_00